MATLASIPEANTSLPNPHGIRPFHRRVASFERMRPRSRVLVLSRRPTRVRNLDRQPLARNNLHHEHDQRHIPAQGFNGPERRSQRGDVLSKRADKTQWPPPICLSETATPADLTFETSVSSVDLDSFPLPPSCNAPLHPHGNTDHFDPENPTDANAPQLPANDLTRGLATPTRDTGISTARRRFGVAATDIARASKHTSVDSALVEAITRAIVQQLRLFSTMKQGEHARSNQPKSNTSPTYACDSQSRASSRREALDRFAKDLGRYAENTGPKGKKAGSSPTLTKSGATLHTVSALMPFRPEFRAAGLAVTSKDQAQRLSIYATKAGRPRPQRRHPSVAGRSHLDPPQLDGPRGDGPMSSTSTEISFARSQDMDEWRYALIDEAPVRKQKRAPKPKKSKKRCLPCFPANDDHTTDAEWAHFKLAPSDAAPRQSNAAGPSSRMPAPTRPPPPRPVEARRPKVDSVAASPRHAAGGPGARVKRRTSANAQVDTCQDPQAKGKSTSRKHGRASDGRPVRLRSDQAGLARDAKQPGREPPTARPYQSLPGREISRGMAKAQPATALEAGRAPVTSALPSTWGRQDGPVSNLEEELEKTARLVAETKSPCTSRRPTQSNPRPRRPASRYDPNQVGICCRSSRGLPSRATAPPNIPKRTSSIRGSIDSNDLDFDDCEIADRDVLRGLHVAASAACDEEVDAFVLNRTGLRIRRFLADLMALEALGDARPGEDSEQRARRRRAEMRKLKQQVRRSREIAMTGGEGLI